MKNNSGQLTIEAVVILSVLVSVMFAGTRALREKRVLASLVQQPWSYVAGMIENGMWMPPEAGKGSHPNHITRHGSPSGDTP